MADELHNQLFAIRRSVRYHDRRTGFFERLHRSTNVITILLAGVALMELAGKGPPLLIKILAVIGAVLGSADLIIGFSRHADLHRDLKRRFVRLERQIDDKSDPHDIRRKRLDIEAEEPPIYRVLDLLCHNEMCAAAGHNIKDDAEHFYRIPFLQKLTANLLRWENFSATVRTFADPKAGVLNLW
ncbi:MAG TPA: hypothetical protein VN750_19595 [Steroidobacteraceae bacterium]|nr:hypothetical protein [Steroidobacteraceae bacterium]